MRESEWWDYSCYLGSDVLCLSACVSGRGWSQLNCRISVRISQDLLQLQHTASDMANLPLNSFCVWLCVWMFALVDMWYLFIYLLVSVSLFSQLFSLSFFFTPLFSRETVLSGEKQINFIVDISRFTFSAIISIPWSSSSNGTCLWPTVRTGLGSQNNSWPCVKFFYMPLGKECPTSEKRQLAVHLTELLCFSHNASWSTVPHSIC